MQVRALRSRLTGYDRAAVTMVEQCTGAALSSYLTLAKGHRSRWWQCASSLRLNPAYLPPAMLSSVSLHHLSMLASCLKLCARVLVPLNSIVHLQHARSSCSVACVGGKLYVMGGSTGNEQLHGSEPCTMVERYDPLTGQWSSSTPLSCARTGLAAVSI